jgi:predicted HTH transcriptional regulator
VSYKNEVYSSRGAMDPMPYITVTSRATTTRDLQELVERGVLVKTGELKKNSPIIRCAEILRG